jgi:hypothetical protein
MGRSDCLPSPRRLRVPPLYAAVGLLWATGQALPWCPRELSAHAAPATPEGPQRPWQRWWSSGHRSSPPGNGVDALHSVYEATPGFAARYGLRGCTLTRVSARQGTRWIGLPLAPPSSYPGALPAPGAGLPPASSRVSTACYQVPVESRAPLLRDAQRAAAGGPVRSIGRSSVQGSGFRYFVILRPTLRSYGKRSFLQLCRWKTRGERTCWRADRGGFNAQSQRSSHSSSLRPV